MIRILFITRSLNAGGAERQLIQLVKGLDKARFRITVATFYDGGGLRADLESVDKVELVSLKKRGRWDLLAFLYRLVCLIFEIKPHIVHGYMGGANQLGLIAKLVGAKVVWGIRASNVDLSRYEYGWIAALLFRVGAWLSRFCDLIIVNSHAGQHYYYAHGYDRKRMVVIPNGIDIDYFRPDREGGRRLRQEWGVPENAILIGLVARLDPMKDHPNFLRAAALLARAHEHARFVCVGSGSESIFNEMRALGEALGLESRLIWVGAHADMAAVYNAMDIVALSSFGEGFPNVIGEAMACEVLCVATDVGDSANVIADTGLIVPPRNPAALADALGSMLTLDPASLQSLGVAARMRIVREFSLQELISETTDLLIQIADQCA